MKAGILRGRLCVWDGRGEKDVDIWRAIGGYGLEVGSQKMECLLEMVGWRVLGMDGMDVDDGGLGDGVEAENLLTCRGG